METTQPWIKIYPPSTENRPRSHQKNIEDEVKTVVLARAKRLIAAMATSYPTLIPGLRSPHDTVGGLVYFGRMLDKIRLHAAGALPADWQAMRGSGTKGTFDWRCCEFLQLDYAALETETLKGDKDDAALLEWAFQHGRRPSEQEIEVWNAFMTKRGWRDAGTPILHKRLADIGLPPGTVETMFEFLDLDEGRRTV
jgi:gluconokinase